MRCIALRPIRHTAGTIKTDETFEADAQFAQTLIDEGAAVLEGNYDQVPWSGQGYWRIQPEWEGQTVAIVAGGPSVTTEQMDTLSRADPKLIAINNAVALIPWADILYWCDARWYEWHRAEVQAFAHRRVTLENLALQKELEVRSLRDYGVTGWAANRDGITNGRNSGYQAVHIAAWLGAARVLLIGFDMRQVDGRMHWHTEHPAATSPHVFPAWLEAFNEFAPLLKRHGVEVINCTPGSALQCFPYQPLDEALGVAMFHLPLQQAQTSNEVEKPEAEPEPPAEEAPQAADEAAFLLPEVERRVEQSAYVGIDKRHLDEQQPAPVDEEHS